MVCSVGGVDPRSAFVARNVGYGIPTGPVGPRTPATKRKQSTPMTTDDISKIYRTEEFGDDGELEFLSADEVEKSNHLRGYSVGIDGTPMANSPLQMFNPIARFGEVAQRLDDAFNEGRASADSI